MGALLQAELKEDQFAKIEDFATLRDLFQDAFTAWTTRFVSDVTQFNRTDFSQNPEDWQELFKEAFSVPVTHLLFALQKLTSLVEKKSLTKQQPVLVPYEYTPKYSECKKLNAYAKNSELIKKVEMKILQFITAVDFRQQHITGRILSGSWTGHLHAHIPAPLGDHRIVYIWTGKKVVFETIETHKQLGIY